MNARLLLVASLLSICSGETSDEWVQKIQVSAGQTVVLPCQIDAPKRDPTVEWSKEDQSLDRRYITLLLQDGSETFAMKHKDFECRTSLFMNKVKNGNISLRISNVRPSDAGTYKCIVRDGRPRKVVTTLELIVCAATEPKLSVVPGDVQILQCEVSSSLPQLNMSFLDHQETVIDAEELKRHSDSSGCFTITRRVAVPTASHRVICRVHQPQTNESRDAQIYFTANNTESCTVCYAVAVIAAVVALAVGIALGSHKKKIYSKCVGRQTPPESNQPSVQSTDDKDANSYLLANQTDSGPTVPSEHLRQMEGPESQLQEKEKIINQQPEELKHIRSTQSPVARQPDQPYRRFGKDISLSQTSPDISSFINPDRRMGKHSCSSLSADHGPVSSGPSQNSISENEPLRRSRSLSEPCHNLLQRRYTFSGGTLNRFSVLADLPEDSEQLLSS